jgi:hypothetical protein
MGILPGRPFEKRDTIPGCHQAGRTPRTKEDFVGRLFIERERVRDRKNHSAVVPSHRRHVLGPRSHAVIPLVTTHVPGFGQYHDGEHSNGSGATPSNPPVSATRLQACALGDNCTISACAGLKDRDVQRDKDDLSRLFIKWNLLPPSRSRRCRGDASILAAFKVELTRDCSKRRRKTTQPVTHTVIPRGQGNSRRHTPTWTGKGRILIYCAYTCTSNRPVHTSYMLTPAAFPKSNAFIRPDAARKLTQIPPQPIPSW